MNNFFYILVIAVVGVFLASCSSYQKAEIDDSTLSVVQTRDYIDHMASLGVDYLKSEDVNVIKVRPETIEFLESIFDRLISNNQVLLTISEKPSFFIIQHKSPFLFSLPKSQFFFSSALIERYLKSEELFVAAFASEVLRSNRFIYEKKIMLPLGFNNTEKMVQLTRLKSETKQQVNEWTYYILKRSGYDSSAYLNWIQIQNRNTLDFSMYLGDSVGISKEEHLFKNFMAKQGVLGVEKRINEANSSKDFYKLLNNIVSKK
jgi:hypothetical protein